MAELDNNSIETLLPFYVNGSLNDAEVALVEQELANNQSLQQEVIFLQSLRKSVKEQELDSSPGELGLKRLQKSVSNASVSEKKQPTSKNIWRFMAVAACLVLVIQTVVVNLESESTYTAAGGKTATLEEGSVVSVTFAPNVSELIIRQLLIENNVAIIDGPSALGIYRLSVTGNPDKLVTLFKARPDVIESIQLDD